MRLLGGQDEGFRADPQQGAQPGGRYSGVLHGVREQRRALCRAVGGQRCPPGDRPAQPDQPVQPVERARCLLVPVEDPDVEVVAEAGDRRVPPRRRTGPVHPAQLGQRRARRGERGRDRLPAGPLRHGTCGVAHRQPDRPAQQERDEHREHRGVQGGQARHRVHPEGQPQRVAPAGPSGQVDDRGVGHQPGQVPVQQGEVARAPRGHGDGPVELVADAAAQHDAREADQGGRRDAGDHRLAQPPGLAADDLTDGQCHRQQDEDQDGQHPKCGHYLAGKMAAGLHDVGLHARRGGLGHQARRYQHGDAEARGSAAQQVTRAADPARQIILDYHRGGSARGRSRGRPGAGPLFGSGPQGGLTRAGPTRAGLPRAGRARRPRRPLGCRHLTIVSPGPGAAAARDLISAACGRG